jgi:hypothetical protein
MTSTLFHADNRDGGEVITRMRIYANVKMILDSQSILFNEARCLYSQTIYSSGS